MYVLHEINNEIRNNKHYAHTKETYTPGSKIGPERKQCPLISGPRYHSKCRNLFQFAMFRLLWNSFESFTNNKIHQHIQHANKRRVETFKQMNGGIKNSIYQSYISLQCLIS